MDRYSQLALVAADEAIEDAGLTQAALDKERVGVGITPDAVDYLNAHATSTPVGDLSEAAAITQVFGQAPARLHVSATKSMTGHLLGAAGAVEAIACLLALRDGIIPPTINLVQRDERIDPGLKLTPNQAVHKQVRIAMSNTSGFGGHNAVVVFEAVT